MKSRICMVIQSDNSTYFLILLPFSQKYNWWCFWWQLINITVRKNLWSKILLSARIILFYPGLFGTVIYLIYAILYTQRDGHHFFYFYSFQKWWPSQHSSLFNFSSSSFFRIKFSCYTYYTYQSKSLILYTL